MFQEIIAFFVSWFNYPDLPWSLILVGIGLALVFGAIWLTCFWPPLFKRHWLWAVLATGAFLGLAAAAFIQIPLQVLIGDILGKFWSQQVLMQWVLLAGIPQILLSGLVQEGAKMVPMVVWWWRSDRNVDPKMGLIIGAFAGAGLGIFEATWVHNNAFAAGWTWQVVQTSGLVGLVVFLERFFLVAFHISVSALAGYGLAKGWGWQFYLVASGLHGLINYSAVLSFARTLSGLQLEVYIVVLSILITAAALWLRWRRDEMLEYEPEPEVKTV
jgi:RsiW-degrading membrane proteinase PrsW (M82 family)